MNAETFSHLEKQVSEWNRPEGLNMIDLLEMADPLRKILNWIVRRDQVTLIQLSEFLEQDIEKTRALVELMSSHDLLTEIVQDNNAWLHLRLTIRAKKTPTTKSILDDF